MIHNNRTKELISQSIKYLCNYKSLDNITINDIVKNCKISRNTFYYHFRDKQDAINWVFQNDIATQISPITKFPHWSDATLKILKLMENDKCFYIKALNISGQNCFHDFGLYETAEWFESIIDFHLEGRNMNNNIKYFIAKFIAYGLSEIVNEWAKNGMVESAEEIKHRLVSIIDNGLWVAIDELAD
jgi:probable dihydroxyacetone kinase regulator